MHTQLKTNLLAACFTLMMLLGALPGHAQSRDRGAFAERDRAVVAERETQDDSASQPPAPPPVPERATLSQAAPTDLIKAPSEDSFALSTGLNVGLVQADLQLDHFHMFMSTTIGVPLLSSGQIIIGNVGIGYTTALTEPGESMWYLDLFAQGLGGTFGNTAGYNTRSGMGALGAGVGVRYLHKSGLTIGFKLPVFGVAFGGVVNNYDGSFSGPSSVAYYYFGNLLSTAPVTIGFRF